ncbi:Z-ring formation inhibitor MciZ [Pradoshia eiseniae]|uniref:Z-ring formation inhibitor MciZ n=1 Tax=Pradoshia eiseniae TaxID=2064768 RepID=A0A2S7N443_9BACI|nr:Z-ring formation inhibitor MciZ [Pradoshia eiseniae]PQD96842.1 Z-ring formation inhibitor MciZ [Pradoshia eiseniae]
MRVKISGNQIIMSGKAWEIRAKLREYSQKYVYVIDMILDVPRIK